MLDTIFALLLSNGAVQVLGAVLWGAASVLLSPCGIAVVPLVVGYIGETAAHDTSDTQMNRSECFFISCAFCSGIVVNLLLVAFVTSGFGMLLGGHERLLTFITAGVFILMGLHLTGLVTVRLGKLGKFFRPVLSRESNREHRGLRGALALGIVSGLAVGPCSIAYISPVLSIAMSQSSNNPVMAIVLVLGYALGYSAVLVLAGTFAQLASDWLNRPGGRALKILNVLCGVALIASGVYLVREQLLLW